MFGLGPATRIYIAVEGVDLRKVSTACTDWCETGLGRIR